MSAVSGGESPGVAADRRAEALRRMRAVVGDAHVLEGDDRIAPRALDTLPTVHRPAAFVAPGSVDEVRAVVAIAGETGVSLWPISRGRNWAYGAATPNVDGSIVLTLERLDRIHEVNEELGYAVIEPGVTFAQLHEHLRRNGLRLWIDPTDSAPDGSVLGNALDRGLGMTPYGDHFGNLCGLDVVLADGQVIRTGGGGPDSQTLHTYRWGVGPDLTGLFGQSGLGIVVRAGIWLMPEPEAYTLYVFDLARESDLPHVIDACRRLILGEVIRTRVYFANNVGRLVVTEPCSFAPGAARTYLSPAELAARCRYHGIAAWLLSGGLYGTREQVRLQRRELARAIGRYGRLRFLEAREVEAVGALRRGLERASRVPGLGRPVRRLTRALLGRSLEALETLRHVYDRAHGRPTEYFLRIAYFKARRPPPAAGYDPARDGGGIIWIAPSIPFSGRHQAELERLCRPLFAEYGFDFLAALMPHNARALTFIMGILYFKDDPAEAARAEALYLRLRAVIEDAGYRLYRVSSPHQEAALARAPDSAAVAARLKQALDPRGAIAPGRYGVGRPPAS